MPESFINTNVDNCNINVFYGIIVNLNKILKYWIKIKWIKKYNNINNIITVIYYMKTFMKNIKK